MRDFDDFEQDLVDSIEVQEEQELHSFDYVRVTNSTRKDGLICIVFPDKKTKCFSEEDIQIDEHNKVVSMSSKTAIKRGFI